MKKEMQQENGGIEIYESNSSDYKDPSEIDFPSTKALYRDILNDKHRRGVYRSHRSSTSSSDGTYHSLSPSPSRIRHPSFTGPPKLRSDFIPRATKTQYLYTPPHRSRQELKSDRYLTRTVPRVRAADLDYVPNSRGHYEGKNRSPLSRSKVRSKSQGPPSRPKESRYLKEPKEFRVWMIIWLSSNCICS